MLAWEVSAVRFAAALALFALLVPFSVCPLAASPLDINACNYSDLLAVPGLGPRLADALLDEHWARGAFRSPADLARVSGIGPRTAVRLGAHFAFPGPTAGAPSPAGPPATRSEVAASGVACRVGLRAERAPGGPEPGPPACFPVDLNSASEAALTTLPGIGKVLAARLVEFRTKHGRLRGPADLARIKGLGGHRGETLAGLVVFR
jgi:competence protein ComEA